MNPSARRALAPGLIYAALSSGIVSSLGMLLVPSIAVEMDISVNTAQWMLTINLLVGAVTTPIMGRLSDGPHKKRLFLCALTIILVGSVVCAVAQNFTVFQIGRALQGVAYGVFPVAISLARRYVPAAAVTNTMSSLAVCGAMGAGIGYPLTGVMAGVGGFRASFAFGALFMMTAILVVWRAVPRDSGTGIPERSFDAVGAGLLGAGLAGLLLGVSEGPIWGWVSLPTLAVFAGAALALTAWSLHELRTRHPLIDLRVFRERDIVLAHGTAIALGATMYIVLSIVSLVAQAPLATGYGIALPVLWAGFVMLPFSVGSLLANRVIRVVRREGSTALILPVAAALVMTSAILLAYLHDELWYLLLGMFLNGLGVGATYAALPGLIARRVAIEEFGSAVSFNQVLRTVGGSIGSAIAGAAIAASLISSGFPSSQGVTGALLISAAGSAVTATMLFANYLRQRNNRYDS